HGVCRLPTSLELAGARSFSAAAVCESWRSSGVLEWNRDSRDLFGRAGDRFRWRHVAPDPALRRRRVSVVHVVAVRDGCALVARANKAAVEARNASRSVANEQWPTA